jgi:hypothetical protein
MYIDVLKYIIGIEYKIINITKAEANDIILHAKYAIGQIRFEIRIAIYFILMFIKLSWFCFKYLMFWVPKELRYSKYRQIIQTIPLISSVLILIETIIFMIYFEDKLVNSNE